jgi:hypothetical protein
MGKPLLVMLSAALLVTTTILVVVVTRKRAPESVSAAEIATKRRSTTAKTPLFSASNRLPAPAAASPQLPAPPSPEQPDPNARHKTPREQKSDTWEDLKRSGVVASVAGRTADALRAEILAGLPSKLAADIRLDSFQCFQKGCAFNLLARPGSHDGFETHFPTSPTFMNWPGGKKRTAPFHGPDQVVSTTWVLLAPDQAI